MVLGDRRRRSVIVKLVELAIALVVLLAPASALALTRASVSENVTGLVALSAKTRVRGFEQGATKNASACTPTSTQNASGKSECAGQDRVRVHHSNRQWSPELGAFLSPDEFVFFHQESTLWGWPGQNPFRNRDPWGRVVPTPSPEAGSEYFGFEGVFTFTNVGLFMFSSAHDAAKAGNYGEAALDAASGLAALWAAESNLALEAWVATGMPGLGAALGPKACPNPKVYHYTSRAAASNIKAKGLHSQSSATNVGTYTAQEAVERLGLKTPPEVVIEIENSGRFIQQSPSTVPPHYLGPGGGADFTNPKLVPPECILCVNPVEKL